MSTAISCTRAAVPRVTPTAARCRRFASTEMASSDAATAPISSSPRSKPPRESLSVTMHRRMYPSLYSKIKDGEWRADERVSAPYVKRPLPKKMGEKWAPIMRQEGVQRGLSAYTSSDFA
jgi:large subunit ribosomal protein L19